MRVVGYVRELSGPPAAVTAFMQAEGIRRWVRENGHHLVAICQDATHAERPGYRALCGILAAGEVDMVLLATLDALSADKVVQEVMLADLHSRGGAVTAVDAADVAALSDENTDPARRFIRDVLYHRAAYEKTFGETAEAPGREAVVELISKQGPKEQNPPPPQISAVQTA